MDTKTSIFNSLDRAKQFLLTAVSVPGEEFGIKRCSSYHDVARYPDMCLPATYNATHSLILLGAYDEIGKEEQKQLANFINSFQQTSGAYRFRHMKEDEIWKGKSLAYSWNYIDNHITNYSMGVLKSLGEAVRYPLKFVDAYKDPKRLEEWLNARDLSDPWLEGNNIVNMASFLIHELEGRDDDRLKELMDLFFRWHNEHQDPNTGFWGTNHPTKPASVMEGMAGAAHNFHLYFYYNREIPFHKPIVDYCLEFVQGEVKTACLDIDVVDVLVNMIPYGYRVDEIKAVLETFAKKLCDFQNEDGGYADEKSNGVRRMDGWVKGYFEPQGLSNCFATWFRSATLAMIACALYEEEAFRFRFRNTIGIGYFNRLYFK